MKSTVLDLSEKIMACMTELVVYSSACAIFISILSLVAELSLLELVNFTKSLLSRILLLHFCKYC